MLVLLVLLFLLALYYVLQHVRCQCTGRGTSDTAEKAAAHFVGSESSKPTANECRSQSALAVWAYLLSRVLLSLSAVRRSVRGAVGCAVGCAMLSAVLPAMRRAVLSAVALLGRMISPLIVARRRRAVAVTRLVGRRCAVARLLGVRR